MIRRTLILLLILLMTNLEQVFAAPYHVAMPINQTFPRFSSMEIGLWPEYDQASMLVIYTFTLSSDTPVPASLSIRIPTAAGLPNALATGVDVDNLFDIEYDRHVEGQWSYIRFKTSVPVIRLEYYDPTLTLQGTKRQFVFRWESDYDIDNVYLQVQQPFGASNLHISPTPKNGAWVSDNVLNYYNAQFSALAAKTPLALTVTYQKETEQLSISGLQVKPTVPITANTAGRTSLWSTIPWILLIPLAIILIFVVAIWYWRQSIPHAKPIIDQHKKPPHELQKDKVDDSEVKTITQPNIHCHHCGKRAGTHDLFCRSCGTRLRAE